MFLSGTLSLDDSSMCSSHFEEKRFEIQTNELFEEEEIKMKDESAVKDRRGESTQKVQFWSPNIGTMAFTTHEL